jgi:hypothetical protein
MLGRRELSGQIRQMARPPQHDPSHRRSGCPSIEERAIDDNRVAEAIAVWKRASASGASSASGANRERRHLPCHRQTRAGQVFGNLDDDDLLESALAKRLRRGATIGDVSSTGCTATSLGPNHNGFSRLKKNHKGHRGHELGLAL